MKGYFNQPGINRYIAIETDVDLGKLVTEHYLKGKEEPAYYMQAGDDFYMIGTSNPLGLPRDIPVLSGRGISKFAFLPGLNFMRSKLRLKLSKCPILNIR